MSVKEWTELSKQNEKLAIRKTFESYYPRLANISMRYGKDDQQAEAMIHYGFYHFISRLRKQISGSSIDDLLGTEFIRECVRFVKELRKEYFVSYTVHVRQDTQDDQTAISDVDHEKLQSIDRRVLIQILRQLPPAQRLVFNLHIIEGFDLRQTADLMDSSPEAVKLNLEHARRSFQTLLAGASSQFK
ncbi:MAG TPA: sigma-70 family RNA polymerase sigma factor [Bacteroidia bacterium]|nr:sigma-70 family RNA polymerase sigma factor [Bacteroidia bacterium]